MFAGELLQKAEYLLRMGVSISDIIQGYEIARDKALEILESQYVIGNICRFYVFGLCSCYNSLFLLPL